MTKYYTTIVSEKVFTALQEIDTRWFFPPTYAEVFDWLLDKGLSVEIEVGYNGWNSQLYKVCNNLDGNTVLESASWHSVADAAILKAIETLK